MKPFLPPEVLNKRKLGFNPPVGSWLNGELRPLTVLLLGRERLQQRGLFRPEAVADMLQQHACGRRDFSLKIWALLMLEIWASLYMDGRSVGDVQEGIDRAVGSAVKRPVAVAV